MGAEAVVGVAVEDEADGGDLGLVDEELVGCLVHDVAQRAGAAVPQALWRSGPRGRRARCRTCPRGRRAVLEGCLLPASTAS